MTNTKISGSLEHKTKFIDPRSGQVLREGTTPMSTVGAFKTQGSDVPDVEGVALKDEVAGLKEDIGEIKELLKGLSK